jgi:hypothetical protein
MQVLAPGIFHPNRYAVIPLVVYRKSRAALQPIATLVFHLSQPAIEHTFAARFFHLSRHDFAPMFFHISHLVVRMPLAHVRFVSGWVSD